MRELDISSLSSICLPYKDRDQRAHSHVNNTCSLGLSERNQEEIRNENFLKSNFSSVEILKHCGCDAEYPITCNHLHTKKDQKRD